MFCGRLDFRRVTLTVCAFIPMVAMAGVCSGQAPAERTPATNGPAAKTAPAPPEAGGNVSPPGMAAKSPAKAVEAGLPTTTTPKTPPATVTHNPAPSVKAGPASGRGVGVRSPKTATPSESSTAPGRRDPFKAWVAPSSASQSGSEFTHLPAGTRGLVISGLQLEGIVRQEPDDEMIAVVTNYTKRAYFLRVNDAVYNGVVSKITPEAIYFKQNTLDSRGQVVTREVEIKLGSAPGEGR